MEAAAKEYEQVIGAGIEKVVRRLIKRYSGRSPCFCCYFHTPFLYRSDAPFHYMHYPSHFTSFLPLNCPMLRTRLTEDLAKDYEALGGAYNAFSLNENGGSLPLAIERVGQASDGLYLSLQELVWFLSSFLFSSTSISSFPISVPHPIPSGPALPRNFWSSV